MNHNCNTDDRKLPIDRPCSACSAGDYAMEHHGHCPPFGDPQPQLGTCPECGSSDKERRLHQVNYLPPAACIHPWHDQRAAPPSSPGAPQTPSEQEWNGIFADRQKFIREWGDKNGLPNMGPVLLDTFLTFWAELSQAGQVRTLSSPGADTEKK